MTWEWPEPEDVKNRKVTRVTFVTDGGRIYEDHGVSVYLDYQDDGRTLKVFVSKRTG